MTNTCDEPVTGPADATELVERLQRERLIGMAAAAADLYPPGTHFGTVTRHALKGIRLPNGRVLKLEAIRVGGRIMTSRAAVVRFVAAQNEPVAPAPTPTPTPKQRDRAARAASAKLDALLGTN